MKLFNSNRYISMCLVTLSTYLLLSTAVHAQDPARLPDFSPISISGEVSAVEGDTFLLKHDKGAIRVEMDDWDDFNEASAFKKGDRVTVYGVMDTGFVEKRSIEADSVYAHGRDTFFFANDVDEEGDYILTRPLYPEDLDGLEMSLVGTVESVDGREFTLNTGLSEVIVDTDELIYNPLDDDGYQQIDSGDRVSVIGDLDIGFFEEDEVKASAIILLEESKKSNS